MDPISSATSSPTPTGSDVQLAAGISVQKKAENLQANAVAQLLQGLPQPALATSGTLGTQINTYA
jgi:hypothetical protein